MTHHHLPISPFINPDLPRFKLNEGAFMAEELAGLTLGYEGLLPGEMAPVLDVLAAY